MRRISEREAGDAVKCPGCGAKNEPDVRTCTSCGAPVLDDLEPSGFARDSTVAPRPTIGTSTPGPLFVGRAGEYRMQRKLAEGGMGVAYLATDRRLGRDVVVKRIRHVDPEMVERFLREIDVVKRLEHENVITIYDWNVDEDGPFIVMRYLGRGTLQRHVDREGRLDDEELFDLSRGLGRALVHVHEHGILHRDIKPSNVLLTMDGQAVLSDFGLARSEAGSNLTSQGQGLGTRFYAAPEQ